MNNLKVSDKDFRVIVIREPLDGQTDRKHFVSDAADNAMSFLSTLSNIVIINHSSTLDRNGDLLITVMYYQDKE